MLTQFYSPLEGQSLLIVDALLLLFFLVLQKWYAPLKHRILLDGMFGLCWSVIVIASAVVYVHH